MTSQIKVGDFIKGSYKFGCVSGVVVEIKKSIFVINQSTPNYGKFTITNNRLNLTKSRVYQVGLGEGEIII